MRRKPMSSEDRISLRQAQFMGVCLSAQDHDDLYGDDLDNLDGGAVDSEQGDDRHDTAKLLRRLLRTLGVEVGAPTEAELIAMTARKIAELRSAKGASNQPKAKPGNPLIPEGGVKIEPSFMGALDNLSRENAGLKMAKRQSDIALAMAPPPSLSQQRIEEIALSMSRMMGAELEPSESGTTTDEDRAVELLVKYM